MPNQPVEDQPVIDAIGAPEVVGTPEVAATFPSIADLLPAKTRSWIYALLGVWTPVFGVWVGAGAPPSWVGYFTAGVSGAGFGLAVSNVPKATGG